MSKAGARRRSASSAMPSLTWRDVWRHRLARHHLAEPAPLGDLTRVVGEVCGIHAQLMPSAELSIGMRVRDATKGTVRDALWTDRTLVKTHGLRGTLHLFPAVEFGLWQSALGAGRDARSDRDLVGLGITRAQFRQIIAAIGQALDGQRLTTVQLEEEVARRVGSWAIEVTGSAFVGGWSRVRYCLGAAARAGVLCFGPNEGRNVTYVRPDQWLGAIETVDPWVALREVVRRYVAAFGPTTRDDVVQWLMKAAAGKAFEDLADELTEVDVDGWRAWMLRKDVGAMGGGAGDVVVLLPHFDCYIVGTRPRDALVPPEVQRLGTERRLKRVDFHSGLPVLIVNGVVAGLWERKPTTKRVAIKVEPFVELSARQRRLLEHAAADVGRILMLEPSLEIGRVEARPHL